jgi:uncharacterized protein YacL
MPVDRHEPSEPSLDPTPAVLDPLGEGERRRTFLIRIVRIGFVVLFLSVTLLSILGVQSDAQEAEIKWAIAYPVILLGAAAFAGLILLLDYLTPRKKIATLVSILVGLLGALAASIALSFVVDLLIETWVGDANSRAAIEPIISTVKVLIGITIAYLAITTVLQTQDDFRLVIPYVEFAKQIRGVRPLVLDSSVLIDGRLLDIAETGFIQAPLVIPHFVVAELQLLADSSDRLKRAKGRRGLDAISKLQRSPSIDVSIDETSVPGKAVDQMLVELAGQMPGVVVTTDSGLSRVAAIAGVVALNLNDLANTLKPSVLAGEQLLVKVIRAGEQPGQGVGYLEDGTMIVIEDGEDAIGSEIGVTVSSSLQTSAGRMIFARQRAVDGGESSDHSVSEQQPGQPSEDSGLESGSEAEVQRGSPEMGPRRRPPQGRNPRR